MTGGKSDRIHCLGKYSTHEFGEPPNIIVLPVTQIQKMTVGTIIGVSLELETSLVARRRAKNVTTTMFL